MPTVKWILALTIVSSTAACGPTVSYAPFRPAPIARQVPSSAVEVFFTPPRCAFVEIGMLESQTTFSTLSEGLDTMRAQAGARGADGIILVDHQDGTDDHHGGMSHRSRAIAIVRDPSCAADLASQYRGQPYRRPASGAPGAP